MPSVRPRGTSMRDVVDGADRRLRRAEEAPPPAEFAHDIADGEDHVAHAATAPIRTQRAQ